MEISDRGLAYFEANCADKNAYARIKGNDSHDLVRQRFLTQKCCRVDGLCCGGFGDRVYVHVRSLAVSGARVPDRWAVDEVADGRWEGFVAPAAIAPGVWGNVAPK